MVSSAKQLRWKRGDIRPYDVVIGIFFTNFGLFGGEKV